MAMSVYQESVTTGQTETQTDAGKSDPYVRPCFAGDKKKFKKNKHTVSIAEAIHVPYRPQQISKRHNSRKNTWKDT